MARTKLGANAIFSGTQKGLSILSDRCYALSGVIGVAQAEVSMLDFSTEANIIKADIQLVSAVEVSDNYEFKVKFNGQTIWKQRLTNTVQLYPYGIYPIQLVIPPLTKVEITLYNVSADTSREWSVSLTGRIYNA